jgi:hypothetical protein
MFVDICSVPVLLSPARKKPFSGRPPVIVPIADCHHDPSVLDFVLGPAVHRTGGMIRVRLIESDPVAADLMDRPPEPPQHTVDMLPESFTTGYERGDPDIRYEQLDPSVHIPPVYSKRVADWKLLNSQMGLDPLQPAH